MSVCLWVDLKSLKKSARKFGIDGKPRGVSEIHTQSVFHCCST